jgi:hypothetical protein
LGSGDYFGLGFLKHHGFAALVASSSKLQRIRRSAASGFSEIDKRFRQRDAIDNQADFAHRSEMMIASGSQPLPLRLATFLSVVSRFNS